MNLLTRTRHYLTVNSALLKQGWPIWLVGFVTFLNGIWSIASVLLTSVPRRVQYFLPFGVFHWTRLLTLVLGFILVYLSLHLFQRRRAAWWVAVFAAGLEMFAHIIHLHTWYTALPQATTFALLIVFRKRFSVRSESRNIWLGFMLLFGSFFVALLYGTFGFWVLGQRDFGIHICFQDGLIRGLRNSFYWVILTSQVQVGKPDGSCNRWMSWELLPPVSRLTACFDRLSSVLFRLPRNAPAPQSLLKNTVNLRSIFQGLAGQILLLFTESRIFYFLSNGRCVAFCLADPVGPAEDRDSVVKTFLKFCEENGWQAAMMMPDDPSGYNQYGLSMFRVGEEAIIDLEHFAAHTINTRHLRRLCRVFEGEAYRSCGINHLCLYRFLMKHSRYHGSGWLYPIIGNTVSFRENSIKPTWKNVLVCTAR